MKNRVHISKTKFHVDEENKVVVCVIEVDMQLPRHPAWAYIYQEMWKKEYPHVEYGGRFTTKAVSRCNPEDTFDVEKGKRIAESRAKAKAFTIATNVYFCIHKGLEKVLDQIATSNQACSLAASVEEEHVEELIK